MVKSEVGWHVSSAVILDFLSPMMIVKREDISARVQGEIPEKWVNIVNQEKTKMLTVEFHSSWEIHRWISSAWAFVILHV